MMKTYDSYIFNHQRYVDFSLAWLIDHGLVDEKFDFGVYVIISQV